MKRTTPSAVKTQALSYFGKYRGKLLFYFRYTETFFFRYFAWHGFGSRFILKENQNG